MCGQQARRQKSAPPLFRRRTLKNEEEKPVRTAFPYRWVICACGLVTIFISIGLVSNVFSIYLPYIVQQNGFTNTQTGLLTTMRTVAALLSMLGADGYYRRFGLRRGLTLPFLATVAAYLLAEPLAKVFVGYDAELLTLTSRAFRLYALSFLIMGFNVYASSFFTALGDGVTSALISFLRTLAFQVIAILLLPMLLGIDGIWLAVTAAELAALAVSAAMLLTKDKVFHYRKA